MLLALGVAAPAPAADIALFFDDNFVETVSGGTGRAENLRETLVDDTLTASHNVTTFTGTSEADWRQALDGKQTLVVPALSSNLATALDAGAIDRINAFIEGGGSLTVAGSFEADAFLNLVRGWQLDFTLALGGAFPSDSSLVASPGPVFAGGPGTLPSLGDTHVAERTNLPSVAQPAYDVDSSNDLVTVFEAAAGNGVVGFIGWDWDDAAPEGTVNSPEWFEVLDRAVGAGETVEFRSITGAIDLNDDNPATNGSLTYASEIDPASGTTTLGEQNDQQNLRVNLGAGITSGSTRFIRLDLASAASFTTDPGLEAVALSNGGQIVDDGALIGGGAGTDYAVFEVTASERYRREDPVFVDVEGIDVTTAADIAVTYRLFETATLAFNADSDLALPLATTSRTAYRFEPALNSEVEAAAADTIEVRSGSTAFVRGNGDAFDSPNSADRKTALARVEIGSAADRLAADGSPVDLADLVGAGTELVISGDFSAVARDGNGNPDADQVQLAGGGLGTIAADSLTDNEARFTVDATTFPDGNEAVVMMTVDGDRPIAAVPYQATYAVSAAPGTATPDRDLGEVSRLEKNGAKAATDLNLTPADRGGNFRNFVRITNRSGIGGEVFVRVRNDAGDAVTLPLGDIEGQPATLAGNASTAPIAIGAIFDAAQARDPSFGLASEQRDKLRVTVEGEFPAIAIDNISVGNDGATFNRFD